MAKSVRPSDKLADARTRELDLAISRIQKEFGEAAMMRTGDESRTDVDVIATGNLVIDHALGVGGFPRGHDPRRLLGPIRVRRSGDCLAGCGNG